MGPVGDFLENSITDNYLHQSLLRLDLYPPLVTQSFKLLPAAVGVDTRTKCSMRYYSTVTGDRLWVRLTELVYPPEQ